MTANRKRRSTPQQRKPSVRGRNDPVPDFSGFLIIRLLPGVVSKSAERLDEVAADFKLDGLSELLKRYNLPSRRLIMSVSVERVLKLEEHAQRESEFAPHVSLASYWRLDARAVPESDRQKILSELLELQTEVDFAYLEQSASAPTGAGANPFEPEQHYLDPAPDGIDARWAWTRPGGRGAGMYLVDLEQGWFLAHEDFPKGIGLLYNDISKSVFDCDHGTAVLGEIVGVDNSVGIVGIAHEASVGVVSHFVAKGGGTNGHVADAIYAAVDLKQPPHVLLLEVERGSHGLPTETDDADFFAIKYAVALDIVVIEAAGNGNIDLDGWQDTAGRFRLDRNNAQFWDSGAILVGAASSATPHTRLPDSNFGSRLDCFAWGENIVSTGYGDRNPGTSNNNKRYTRAFGGTSGASAIIAGAALLVQGSYWNNQKTLLPPNQMRTILSTTGTPQGVAIGGYIGLMPDLRRIIP